MAGSVVVRRSHGLNSSLPCDRRRLQQRCKGLGALLAVLAVLSIFFVAVVHTGTTTARAAVFTYDVPTIGRGDVQDHAAADSSPAALSFNFESISPGSKVPVVNNHSPFKN